MKKLIMVSVVTGLAIASVGCASTSEKTASNDKMETRLKDRDALIQKSDQRRLEALTVSAETRRQQENQKGANNSP